MVGRGKSTFWATTPLTRRVAGREPGGPASASWGERLREWNSWLAMRRMASPMRGAREMVRIFFALATASGAWMVSVMTSSLSWDLSMLAGGAVGEHAVGDVGGDFLRAFLQECFGGVDERAAQVRHVIDQNALRPSTSPMMFITSELRPLSRVACRRWRGLC